MPFQEYITQEGYKLELGAPKPPPAVTNAVSWRDPEGGEDASLSVTLFQILYCTVLFVVRDQVS